MSARFNKTVNTKNLSLTGQEKLLVYTGSLRDTNADYEIL